MHAVRCDHDGLKMAEVQNGHLILRAKHHGETHVKIVALAELAEGRGLRIVNRRHAPASAPERRPMGTADRDGT